MNLIWWHKAPGPALIEPCRTRSADAAGPGISSRPLPHLALLDCADPGSSLQYVYSIYPDLKKYLRREKDFRSHYKKYSVIWIFIYA